MSSVSLNFQQSKDILYFLGALKGRENINLCFSETAICFDWEWSLLRTMSEDTEWITELFWKSRWSRDLTSLSMLIKKVVECLNKEVEPIEVELIIKAIRNAQEGLMILKNKGANQPLINKADLSLTGVRDALSKKSPIRQLTNKLLRRDSTILDLKQRIRQLERVAWEMVSSNNPRRTSSAVRFELPKQGQKAATSFPKK